jgi:hypothetical protein
MTTPIVNVQTEQVSELAYLARQSAITGWDFLRWPATLDLNACTTSRLLDDVLADCTREDVTNGFVTVRLHDLVRRPPEEAAGAATLIAGHFGKPLRVFGDSPHWREVGVDPERPPNRSRGTGLLPLHMDFVNAESPPDAICLLCIRPDPLGGGASIVARIEDCETLVSEPTLLALSAPIYRDGAVRGLEGVGSDTNPFPVFASGAKFKYRYTGHLLSSVSEPSAIAALEELAEILQARVQTMLLEPGDLLVVDQHRAVHGRMPLGPQQSQKQAQERRLMLLSFLRAT